MFGPNGPSFGDLVLEGMMSTVGGYDHLAPRFDTTPFRTPDPLLDLVAEHLRRGPEFHSVLDLCCGTGAVLKRLASLYREGTGVDFSAGMLAQARFEPPEGTTLRLLQSDVLSWEPDREYDVVTCFGAFGHIVEDDQPRFLAMVHRALRPGGRFVFVTAPHPSPLRLGFWASHGFNLVMRVRNALVPPPFVMYYLTFLIPEALDRCKEAGLDPVVTPLNWKDHPRIVLVEAYRRA